jgi:hypothetical protein
MTREQMADVITDAAMLHPPATAALFDAAAAELRKACAGCDYWPHPDQRADWPEDVGKRWCRKWHGGLPVEWPADGTGFCHEWSAK